MSRILATQEASRHFRGNWKLLQAIRKTPLSTFAPSGPSWGLAVMTVMTITAPGASDWSSWRDLYDQGGRSGPVMVMPALRKTKHTKVTRRRAKHNKTQADSKH